jgi:DnaJ-class molecular chaperone
MSLDDPVLHHAKACPTCDGTGQVCANCNGKGKVFVRVYERNEDKTISVDIIQVGYQETVCPACNGRPIVVRA